MAEEFSFIRDDFARSRTAQARVHERSSHWRLEGADQARERLRAFYAPHNEFLYTVVQRSGVKVLPAGSAREFL